MSKHETEKKALELTAIDIFIELYNRNHKHPLRLVRQREKPDALLEDDSRSGVGLEVTHLFYDSEEARLMMSRSELPRPGAEVLERFINVINDRVRNKVEKYKDYSHEYPCMLLIRNVSLLFGMSDVLGLKHKLAVPAGPFTHVWLLSRDFTPDWLLINLYEIEGTNKQP